MNPSRNTGRRAWPALYVFGFFLAVGLGLWCLQDQIVHLIFFALIGASTSSGMLIHARARGPRRAWGRRQSLLLVGLSLFLGAGVFGRQSFQLEGFFFYALGGVAGGVVVHYLVAKILGPLLIGRAWCGWGCWIWMVFDFLPWKRNPERRRNWQWARVAHFLLSLGLVAGLAFGTGYDHGFEWKSTDGLWWFLGGCGLYYAAGIALAASLRDNRAFCKYLCPVTVFLRAGARVSLLKVRGAPEGCSSCGACNRSCPMGVAVQRFVQDGTRVLDPECVLCQRCVAACPQGNLGLSLGLDVTR